MTEAQKLRDYFLGWQCRLRQHAVRNDGGKPSAGMQATLVLDNKAYGPVNTGLVKKNAKEVTSEFMHIVKKTHDPNQRQQSAIKLLSSVYYQHPKEFKSFVTATFSMDSELALSLASAGNCQLQFEQYNQRFQFDCEVVDLAENNIAYQSTYWHNKMFNPVLPARVKVLKLKPDWATGVAIPPVTG